MTIEYDDHTETDFLCSCRCGDVCKNKLSVEVYRDNLERVRITVSDSETNKKASTWMSKNDVKTMLRLLVDAV